MLSARPGERPRRADAQVVAGAGSTVSSPVRGCRSARRQSAARRHPGHHPRPLVRERPQVRRARPTRWTTSSRLGTLTRAGRALPRGRGRVRAERPRRRGHPGRQDHPAQLPGVRGPRRASGSSPARRSSSCASPTATWPRCSAASRRLEGTGEIPLRRLVKEALRMRPVAHRRRRGPAGGEPRPAHRPELRPARHVHHPRQQRPRGGHQDVHAAAARGRERLGPLRRADGRRVDRPRRPRGARARRPAHASARSSPCPGGWRATSSRSPTCSCAGAATWCAPTGSRRTSTASSGPGYDLSALLAQACRMTGLAARARAWVSGCSSSGGAAGPPRSDPFRHAGAAGAARPALRRDRAGRLRRACRCARCSPPAPSRSSSCSRSCRRPWASCRSRPASRRWPATLPFAVVRARARRRRARLRDLWPDAVDNITSGVRAGMALAGGALPARGPAAPRSCASRSGRSPTTTGSPAASTTRSTGSRTG